ncbi:uncharacterized protein [Rutidosis leptorrhynchoides]|uniref:uncharacterized protein n=1 Tax=Rutidosis leptorrhynchoides TaxID=125765 RepID=UPI003A98F4E4
MVLEFVKHQIGNRNTTLAWSNNWSICGPLAAFISQRDIYGIGSNHYALVKDIVQGSQFIWLTQWYAKYPLLQGLNPPLFNDSCDVIKWVESDGNFHNFSVTIVWDTIRLRALKVNWFQVVWFSQCIPRHAFIMWLLIGERLKTQDKLKP